MKIKTAHKLKLFCNQSKPKIIPKLHIKLKLILFGCLKSKPSINLLKLSYKLHNCNVVEIIPYNKHQTNKFLVTYIGHNCCLFRGVVWDFSKS